MNKVILFGSTGNLGKKIAAELQQQGYTTTAVVRNEVKANEIKAITPQIIIADVTNPNSLSNICSGHDIVVSALGKSVSPNDKSRHSFNEIDLVANSFILEEALKSKIKKFVYVSAYHAEKYPHLEYFKVHHQFAEKLKNSGIDYSIIKPPALFSAFKDLIQMARKGHLVTFGKGDKLTNPIYEGDLAKICVQSIKQPKAVIEAGGREIFSRQQINELIQATVNPKKKIRNVPLALLKACLPLLKLTARNMYDKMAFFTEVMQHDTIAPPIGETTLAEYIKSQV